MATLHVVIKTLSEAFAALRAGSTTRAPDDAMLERIALVIYEAMSQPARSYHGIDHAMAVARTDDPVERLAGLFHDVVYLQIDRGISPLIKDLLGLQIDSSRWRVERFAKGAPSDAERRCLALFDSPTWQDLGTESGLNEALSALVATRLLEGIIAPSALLSVQGTIEATIPFRGDEALKTLRKRLGAQNQAGSLQIDNAHLDEMIDTAARVANRDVQSFAAPSTAEFLSSTWLLFCELDPTLNQGRCYSVRTYRKALHAMERLLTKRVEPKNVFVAARESDLKAVAAQREIAKVNLSLAILYMRIKLFPLALIEALAECTGGDAPVEIFLGHPNDPQSVASWATRELDKHLKSGKKSHPQFEANLDAEIFQLLWIGRSGVNSFDLAHSPLGALLFAEYGGPYLVARHDEALAFFEGSLGALPFLQKQAPAIVQMIAERIASVSTTRRVATVQLLRTLRTAA